MKNACLKDMKARTVLFRSLSISLCFALVNLCMPGSVVLAVGKPLSDMVDARMKEAARASKDLAKRKAVSQTRRMTDKELTTLQGRTAQCPYLAGASKWDPQFMGVDLVTGNYATSATDLSFDGGYGVPVNITRSYSANDANEGPFGPGWTLSADVRTTAGGILKSKVAPVRAVPVTYKERSPLEVDPNVTTQPIEAVTAEDSSGKQETIQKDADGVLSPPAWDLNQSVSTYANVVQNGNLYQVMTSQTVTTPEGTTYVYGVHGNYLNGGTTPYSNPSATPTPANILKIESVTDRHGNKTTYSYGSGYVTFQKIDGYTSENKLTSVKMPNGHTITLTWGGTAPANRVSQIADDNNQRVVNYTYDPITNYLVSVKSPGGLTTSFGYGVPTNNIPGSTDASNPVLNSIKDPRGLITSIQSQVYTGGVLPYAAYVEGVTVTRIGNPDGSYALFNFGVTYPSNVLTSGSAQVFNSAGSVQYAYTGFSQINGNTLSVTTNCVSLRSQYDSYNSFTTTSIYDTFTQNCTETISGNLWANNGGYWNAFPSNLWVQRLLGFNGTIQTEPMQQIVTFNSYNFRGQPLDVTVQEQQQRSTDTSFVTTRTATNSLAYWGADKYFQQKATCDQAGRLTFTDYYTSSDSNLGNRGQSYQAWDPKYGGVSINTAITPPSGTRSQDAWRYQVQATPGQHSAQFTYDAVGRGLSVQKLQAATAGVPSTYRYVTTQTTYGADGPGSWGQATKVVEDFGGIGRTTQNLGYTGWGKANDVIDGSGQRFQTAYDPDGNVLGVTQAGVGPIVTYEYGISGIETGQVTKVTDNLTNVRQEIAYTQSGNGVAMPASVTEYRNSVKDNVAAYSYGDFSNRNTASYFDGNLNLLAAWGYFDFQLVVGKNGPSWAFQTLCRLNANGTRSPEEFHYHFDPTGKLIEAAFAQTPSNNTPGANGYYDAHLAQTRARAEYSYDPAGRMLSVSHYWDTLNSAGNGFNSEAILAQACDYEIGTGLNRGLKLDSKYYTRTTPGQPNWTLAQTDTYSYDSAFDYLTGASYGDGLANATPSWSYDAAGNRADSVCDNLNRTTSVGGVATTCDVLGNRLSYGSKSYTWDAHNRMKSLSSGGVTTKYAYRADGMRTTKMDSNGVPLTSYRYDGQMGTEDIDYSGGVVQKVTDYGLGARGIDAMYVTQSGTITASYPIYDAHGNMISTLTKQGTGGYQFSALRTFDAWGGIRRGVQTGDPKGRYCASLGHKQDDESGLIYMRARYYEPTSGRFISEDPIKAGTNSLIFSLNCPTTLVDRSGKDVESEIAFIFSACMQAVNWALELQNGWNPAMAIEALEHQIGVIARLSNASRLLGLAELDNGAMLAETGPDGELTTFEKLEMSSAETSAGGLSMAGQAVGAEEIGELKIMIEILKQASGDIE